MQFTCAPVFRWREALRTGVCQGHGREPDIQPDKYCRDLECPKGSSDNGCYNRWSHCIFVEAEEVRAVTSKYNTMCSQSGAKPPEKELPSSTAPKAGSGGATPKPPETDPGKQIIEYYRKQPRNSVSKETEQQYRARINQDGDRYFAAIERCNAIHNPYVYDWPTRSGKAKALPKFASSKACTNAIPKVNYTRR